MNVNSPMHDLDSRKRLSNVCWSHTYRLMSEDTLDTISRCSYYNGQSESLLTGSDDYGHIVLRHGRWLCALCVYVLRDIHKRIYRMILVCFRYITHLLMPGCQPLNMWVSHGTYVRSLGLAMMSTFGESLALQETFMRYTQSRNQSFTQRYLPAEQTIKRNTFKYNC